MISIKYVLSDMDDYDRLMEYLERTGKSANSFIKELINDFFEKEKYVMSTTRIADYFKDYCIDPELLSKLENAVGKERFNMIMDYCKEEIESDLEDACDDRGCSFDGWINQFFSDIECGEIDLNVSDEEFKEMISSHMSSNMYEHFSWNY